MINKFEIRQYGIGLISKNPDGRRRKWTCGRIQSRMQPYHNILEKLCNVISKIILFNTMIIRKKLHQNQHNVPSSVSWFVWMSLGIAPNRHDTAVAMPPTSLSFEWFYKRSNLCCVDKEAGDMFIRLRHLRGPFSHILD